MKTTPFIPVSLVLLLLVGCSAAPQRNAPAPVVRSDQSPIVGEPGPAAEPRGEDGSAVGVYAYREPQPAPPRQAQNPAVAALLSSAGRQQQEGDLNGAVATLERALRIEPRNPTLWHRLAGLRLQQGQYPMVADLAAKSNALAGVDYDLKRENWRLISRARHAMGDSAGARAAEAKMREF